VDQEDEESRPLHEIHREFVRLPRDVRNAMDTGDQEARERLRVTNV